MPWLTSVGTFPRRFSLSEENTRQPSKKFRGRARKKALTSFCYDDVTNDNKKGQYMSRKNRRNSKQQNQNQNFEENNHFALRHINPLTVNQQRVWDAYNNESNLMLHGYAGTGKTFLSMYLALKEVLTSDIYKRVVIIRSVVPSRDMGFLPGTEKQKAEVYEQPYQEICDNLFGRGDGWRILKLKRLVEFTTTSFLRGTTFNDSIIIVDECNNMNFQEIDTVMTRIGNNSRIIFCGDYRQADLHKPHDKTGIKELMAVTRRMPSFEHIEFGIEDIVRSGVVKEYIIQKTEMGL
jgi:phosphate starvation-inducible PhoH-like protein